MLISVHRAAVFGVLAAALSCTSDSFHTGDDAGIDVAEEHAADVGTTEAGQVDATEASTSDAPTSFCAAHAAARFCEDFDELGEAHPWTRWSAYTPTGTAAASALLFANPGVTGQAGEAVVTALGTPAFYTEQIQGSKVASLDIALKVVGAALGATLIRVQANGSTFSMTTDALGGNFIINGDSGTNKTLGPANTGAWHEINITFNGAMATVSEDSSAFSGSVAFASGSAMSYSLDVGGVAAAAGATLVIDNIVLD